LLRLTIKLRLRLCSLDIIFLLLT